MTAVRLDRKVLNAIEEWDYFNMSQNFERPHLGSLRWRAYRRGHDHRRKARGRIEPMC